MRRRRFRSEGPESLPHKPPPANLSRPKRRRRDLDEDEGGVPVEPNNPKNLSGGAAAALEFDED